MKRRLKILFTKIFGKKRVLRVLKYLSLKSRNLASFFHMVQIRYEWSVAPEPEWFDHYGDQFFNFRLSRSPFWAERGLFSLLAMKQGANVLEICCGDGFNSYHFYAIRSNKIIAVDFDKDAIPHAQKYNQAKNVEFRLCDIRTEMPEGVFDNVIWDTAIEHFTELEIAAIMKNIKNQLAPNGILSGSTLVENPEGKSLSHHERELKSKEDLRTFFEPHFKNVKVFETKYPARHSLYFYASDGILPFDKEWESMTAKSAVN